MPISLDEAFAGALGVEFARGSGMADQLDRLGRALEARRDPLTQIGFDTYAAVRDLASALLAPPAYFTPVRIVNLGFLELMAGGTFVFTVLIYLKLDDIWRRLGLTNLRLSTIIDILAQTNVQLALLGACLCGTIPGMLGQIAGLLAAILVALGSYLAAIAQIVVRITVDIGPNLASLDVGELVRELFELAAALGAVALAGGLASSSLLGFGLALYVVAGGLALIVAALNAMPENAADLIPWLTGLALGLLLLIIVAGVLLSRGTALVGALGAVAAAAGFLLLIALALNLMPENIGDIVKPLIALGIGLFLLIHYLKGLEGAELGTIALGLGALAVFMLVLAGAMRIFDATSIEAMQTLPDFFAALKQLADDIVALKDDMATIALGLVGIVVFVGALGGALRLFPADATPALEAMARVFAQLTAISQEIVRLAEGGNLRIVAAGLLAIVVFVGALGLALMLFDETAIRAAQAIAMLTFAVSGLVTALSGLTAEQLFIMGAALAALGATMLVVGVAAAIGGPHLNAMAGVLREMSNLIDTVTSSAGKLAEALRNIPSISLPSLPSLPGVNLQGSRQAGGPIDTTGAYLLHAGEYVLNPEETRALAATPTPRGGPPVSDNSVSVGAVNVTVNAQRVDEESIPALGDEIVRQIASRLAELRREDAFAQGVRTVAG